MNDAEARAWLDSLGEFHMELGLDRVRTVLAHLDHPERAGGETIHVAGTNGKGMTCAFAASILRHAGFLVGLYTSPHLSRPNERIAIAGRPIGDEAFARAISGARIASESTGARLTFFEAMTVAAFLAFRDAKVDARVIEVGLGGRLDATNVVEPAVTVITSIALDHTAVLGSSIEAIAAEKAGILKAARPVVTTAHHPDAVRVIEETARALGSMAYHVREGGTPGWDGGAGNTAALETIRLHDRHLVEGPRGIPLAFRGTHVRDAAAAAATAVHLCVGEIRAATIRSGLELAAWPGRAEQISASVLLDGGHNPDAARALASIQPFRGASRRVLLFAAMADKDRSGILRALAATGPTHLVCTSAGTARSATARMLAEDARSVFADRAVIEAVDDIPAAWKRALEHAGETGNVLVTGSLYLVGRVRELVTGGPPIALG